MLVVGVFRWGARLLATAAAALVIAFVAGEGIGDLRELTDAELGGMGAVFVMLVGTLLGWRWDILGGLLLLAGFGAFMLIERGWPPVPFAAFALAGLLLVVTGVWRRWRKRPGRPAEPGPLPPLARPGPAA
jgi:hypothetical protein